jgi:UDP-N-acetylmuramate--alanine ligase
VFTGAGRRFEVLSKVNGVTVVDDYAHHPAEITATIKAARTMPQYKRVWAVHQPFTYSRTRTMLDEFAEALSLADKVTLTEIMGGREVNDNDIFSRDLADKIPVCDWLPPSEASASGCLAEFAAVADYVAANARDGDLIITMGCGDVNKVAHMITARLKS